MSIPSPSERCQEIIKQFKRDYPEDAALLAELQELADAVDEALPVGCAVVAGLVLGCAALTGLWVWARALWRWVF